MLSALFSVSKNFIISAVEEVKPLGNRLPVFGIFGFPLKTLLVDKFAKKITFFLAPIICSKIDFFEA